MKNSIIKTFITIGILSTSIVGCAPKGIYYKVVFKKYDDAILYQAKVKKGGTAVYKGDDPTKPADFEYYHVFDGWDIDLTNVTSNLETKATYEQKSNHKELALDFCFEVSEDASWPDASNTNYLGKGKSGKLILNEPVIVEGETVNYQSVDFDDMRFDYAPVEFGKVGEYPIAVTYAGLTVTDYLDVVPDVSKWTLIRTYTGSATHNVNGPDWWMMEYIDFYDKGVILNNNSSKPYITENWHDGKSVRIYRVSDGVSYDVIYDYFEEGLTDYSFPDHPDVVSTLNFVADNIPQTIDPSVFTLSIHQSLEEAPSAYGLVDDDNGNWLTVKYDYDSTNKSIKIHLGGYPKPFVYNEEDGKYHYQ